MKKIIIISTFLIFCLLPGCAPHGHRSAQINSMPDIFPDNYESIINDYIKNHFYDPYSVRDLVIDSPTWNKNWQGLVNGGYKYAWKTKVTCNAKNKMGGYIGMQTKYYWIKTNAMVFVTRY